ncbi:MAG TPA: GAF domain-containing protein [Xanthobacteraceae bacterium]|nr:GAF domain-containing protein [Xanthobacteraceae bacterium]
MPISAETACGRAARLKKPVLIPDVNSDPEFKPYLPFANHAGFSTVLSIPLVSREGELFGVTSSHFKQGIVPTNKQAGFAKLCVEFASDVISDLRWGDRSGKKNQWRPY